MTAVTLIALSHFRSHRLTRIETEGRSVALFGPNGAGKTNALEALSMLSPGRGLRRAEAETLARRPESLGWKVSARLTGSAGGHDVETGAEAPGQARFVRIDGKAAPQVRLGALMRMVWLTPAMDRLWTEGAAERRRFLDRTAMGFDPGHAEQTLAYEKAMRDRNRLLRDDVRDVRWMEALEARMAQAGAAISCARAEAVMRLAEVQAGSVTAAETGAVPAFPTAELTLLGEPDASMAAALAAGEAPEEARAAAQASLRSAFAQGRGADYAAGRTLAGPHRGDLGAVYAAKGVEARLCSTGEQKALLISLVLATARALAQATGTPPVLLLDEVAAHLDEDRRAALYAEIAGLGAQAWMTGTGAELFESLAPDALRLAVRETEDGTAIAPA